MKFVLTTFVVYGPLQRNKAYIDTRQVKFRKLQEEKGVVQLIIQATHLMTEGKTRLNQK